MSRGVWVYEMEVVNRIRSIPATSLTRSRGTARSIDGVRSRTSLDRPLLELRHASHEADVQLWLALLELPELAELREDLVLRLCADCAGVDEDQVGVVFVLGELVALGGEEARHALRVVLVHLTAIRNEVKLCHELFEKSGRCVDLTVASAIREVNLARKHSQGGRDAVRALAPPAQSVFACGRDG